VEGGERALHKRGTRCGTSKRTRDLAACRRACAPACVLPAAPPAQSTVRSDSYLLVATSAQDPNCRTCAKCAAAQWHLASCTPRACRPTSACGRTTTSAPYAGMLAVIKLPEYPKCTTGFALLHSGYDTRRVLRRACRPAWRHPRGRCLQGLGDAPPRVPDRGARRPGPCAPWHADGGRKQGCVYGASSSVGVVRGAAAQELWLQGRRRREREGPCMDHASARRGPGSRLP
jgi:hypothetical protein